MLRLFVGILTLAPLYGEVADSAANGFTVTQSWTITATPDAAYSAFMNHVGEWWNSAHTFSRDAHNLSIEAKPMGCFCEKLPKTGGAVRHLEVVYFDPGKVVRFTGALGPMQGMAVSGAMTIQFKAAEGGGTKVDLIYTIGGYTEKGLQTLAPMVDAMLKDQFGRLKLYIETGSPVAGK